MKRDMKVFIIPFPMFYYKESFVIATAETTNVDVFAVEISDEVFFLIGPEGATPKIKGSLGSVTIADPS